MLCQKDIGVVAEHSRELIAVLARSRRNQSPTFPWAFEGKGGHVALATNSEPSRVKVAVFATPILEIARFAKNGLNSLLDFLLADCVRKRLLGSNFLYVCKDSMSSIVIRATCAPLDGTFTYFGSTATPRRFVGSYGSLEGLAA